MGALKFIFRQKFRARREELSLTQRAVADFIEKSEQTVKNWESGRAVPSLADLEKVSELFQIMPQSLLATDNSPPESIHEAYLKVRNARIALEEAEEHLGRLIGKQNNNKADSQESAVLGGAL